MTDLSRVEPIKRSLLDSTSPRTKQDRLLRIKWPRGIDFVPRHHQLETRNALAHESTR
jgi:hypothetical protein